MLIYQGDLQPQGVLVIPCCLAFLADQEDPLFPFFPLGPGEPWGPIGPGEPGGPGGPCGPTRPDEINTSLVKVLAKMKQGFDQNEF